MIILNMNNYLRPQSSKEVIFSPLFASLYVFMLAELLKSWGMDLEKKNYVGD